MTASNLADAVYRSPCRVSPARNSALSPNRSPVRRNEKCRPPKPARQPPPIAGVITGFIGGIIGGLLGGSYVTINGAAAGLIAIVFGAVSALADVGPNGQPDLATGFRYALAVGVICGGFQILMGLAKMGKLTNMFPLSVVHGMLAGIGVIIMAKQIHTLLGVKVSGAMIPTIAAIPSSFANMHVQAGTIGALSLIMMYTMVVDTASINWSKSTGLTM